jgi:uncharacterized protein YdaT
MPVSLSDFLEIDHSELENRGVFDTIMDFDSLYFINFLRLKDTVAPELSDSYKYLHEYFDKIAILLQTSPIKNHRFYKEAYNILDMREYQEICLGYSLKSTAGSGSGAKLKQIILDTAYDIIQAGNLHPEIFEIVGLFEENIGPDRISDMIGRVIHNDLLNYSKHIYSEILKISNSKRINKIEIINGILQNPFNGKDLVLLPNDILHELPVASQWEDIDYVCSINRDVRNQINNVIGEQWSKLSAKDKKRELRKILLKDKKLFESLIKDYQKEHISAYDFKADPLGESLWYLYSKDFSNKYPYNVKKNISNQTDLVAEVHSLCEHFKYLIENNGLSEILYNQDGKPRKERIVQKLFFGIASTYCEGNNSDINPEVNSGRGPVDFKFSVGKNMKVLVEIKLTTSTKLIHGYQTQLGEYEKGERTEDSVYLVIDNGGSKNKLEKLTKMYNDSTIKGIKIHHLIIVDGSLKKSASKF